MKLFMTVDFFDDMMAMPWDKKMLRRFMEMNSQMGVERIYWIYHGDCEDGFWENTGMPWGENYAETFASIGNPYLKTAVEEAHKAGMEIFAVYKPFDLAIQNFPVRDKALSGKMPTVFNFAVENHDLLMRRRCLEKMPAAKIILKTAVKLNSGHKFRLWKSDDNWTYQPVGNIVHPETDGVSVVFDISAETARFFAIESLSENEVANRLDSIIEVESAEGKSIQRTLGLVPRKYRVMDQKNHLKHEFDSGEGFTKEGFYFDYLPGIPSAVSRGEYLEKTFSLSDNEQNVIGVSLEVNEYVPGALEPAEPRAVEYWLKMIKKTLDCGVDGVDIRITNHNSILDWAEYGFNKPVVDEYLKRYGSNPRLEPFNKEKLRCLRGEFYTAFLEKAANMVKGSRRKFCLHVPDMAFGSPEQSTMMEIHWDWRNWLKKGIADEVTFKTIRKGSVFSPEGFELVELCKNKEIPISICPFLHTIPDLSEYLSKIEERGIDAFTVYEAATLWTAEQNGFKEFMPSVNKIIKKIKDNNA